MLKYLIIVCTFTLSTANLEILTIMKMIFSIANPDQLCFYASPNYNSPLITRPIYLSTSLLTENFHSRELYFYSKHIYKHKVKVYQSPLQENCIYLNVDSCQLSTWCPTSNRPPLKVKKHILNCPYCHEKGFIQVSYDTYMIIYALTNFDNLG